MMAWLIIALLAMGGFFAFKRSLINRGRMEREREIVRKAESVENTKQGRYERELEEKGRVLDEIEKTDEYKKKSDKIKQLF